MKIALILLAFVVFGVWQKNKDSWAASNQFPVSASEDACSHKKMCAVVYIAPWCPACEQISPELMILLKNAQSHKEYGMQVVVGAGRTIGDVEKKANSLGMGTMVDKDNSIARTMGVSYFPTFYVIDANRSVLMKDKDALEWINKNLAL